MDDFKGWLLLDVDGPLNPYACKSHSPPAGFVSWRLLTDGEWFPGKEAKRRHTSRTLRNGFLVRLNPDHGARLLAVVEAIGFRLAWATTWQDDANTYIAPAVGLPILPVIGFGDDLIVNRDVRDFLPNGSWKYRGVTEFAAGKPLAWLDDDFDAYDHVATRERFLAGRKGIPTLLHHVSPKIGISDDDLSTVAEWAAVL